MLGRVWNQAKNKRPKEESHRGTLIVPVKSGIQNIDLEKWRRIEEEKEKTLTSFNFIILPDGEPLKQRKIFFLISPSTFLTYFPLLLFSCESVYFCLTFLKRKLKHAFHSLSVTHFLSDEVKESGERWMRRSVILRGGSAFTRWNGMLWKPDFTSV